jgi:hypothetical protein
MSDHDNLTGIFDEITPDMFIVETSAVDESTGTFKGIDAFNASTEERLRGVRATFANALGQINPTAVLTNATTQRVFVPQHDENLGQFLERLQREARVMGAHWFFFAKRNAFSVYYETDDDAERHDVTERDGACAREAAVRGSEPEIGIMWYAERREGEEIHHRHGALKVDGGRIVEAIEGDGNQTLGVFASVLDVVTR